MSTSDAGFKGPMGPEVEESAAGAPAAEAFASVQAESLQRFEAAGTAMLDGLTKAQREISDFVTARLRQDVEVQEELMRCRTFEDVRDVHARFLKTAMDQYAGEATKLMQIGTAMMAPAQRPVG